MLFTPYPYYSPFFYSVWFFSTSTMTSLEEFTSKPLDYVVVGGGTAGLLIAARLSEDPNVTVGVLEAGGNRLNDPMVDCPNAFMQLWDKPEYDWSFQTVPQVLMIPHRSLSRKSDLDEED